MLARFLKFRAKDPLWDHFVNSSPVDPKNDLNPHIQVAPEGAIYPVKTEESDPATLSRTIKELGQWLGVDMVGIVALESSTTPTRGPSDAGGGAEAEVGEGESASDQRPYPFAVVCGVLADYDPEEAKGLGGQQAVQKGAVVSHYLRAYIRELGYRAVFGGPDHLSVAEAAGLGRMDEHGRFVTKNKRPYVHIAEVISTDLHMAPDGALKNV